jgi:hypothetical protein
MFEYVSLYCHDQMVSKRGDVTGRIIIAPSLCPDPFCLRRLGVKSVCGALLTAGMERG